MRRALMEQYKEVLMALACALFALSGVGELAHNLRLVLTGLHTHGVIVANGVLLWAGNGLAAPTAAAAARSAHAHANEDGSDQATSEFAS